MRKAWTLKRTERGVPFHLRSGEAHSFCPRRRGEFGKPYARPVRATASVVSDRRLRNRRVSGGKAQNFLAQGFTGELSSAPCDDRSGAAKSAGIVTAVIRIEVSTRMLSTSCRARSLRSDDGPCWYVAELCRTDNELIGAVFAQGHAGIREMAERRNGIDHAERDTLSDEPVA